MYTIYIKSIIFGKSSAEHAHLLEYLDINTTLRVELLVHLNPRGFYKMEEGR